MENEENRGLINKRASEDQYIEFFQFSFGALYILSLSLSYSWKLRAFLEHSSLGSRKEKEVQRRQMKEKIKQG